MFTCNNLTLLSFTYYLKFILGIGMTIIPLIFGEIIFIKILRYKEKNKKLDKFILKKQLKSFFITLIIFSSSLILHNTLDTNNNKCYMYAKKEIVNEYKLVYNELKKENINDDIKERYLENVLLTSHNNLKQNKNNNKVTILNTEKEDINLINLNNNKKDNFLKETDRNKLNNVYVIDGIFYYPKFITGNKNTYSGRSCPTDPLNQGYNNKYGYNNYFYTRLMKFIEDANKNGHKITISSQGCRTYQTQVNYYNTMERGRAAPPGQSLHGYGIASDLEFYQSNGSVCGWGRTDKSCSSMGWAHQNASKYGLVFPLLNASYKEDWHIEPINKIRY